MSFVHSLPKSGLFTVAVAMAVVLAACRPVPASTTGEASESPSPTLTATAMSTPTAMASPRPTATPSESPRPTASPGGTTRPSADASARCFELSDGQSDEQLAELIDAPQLRDRLPLLDAAFSEPMAFIGSSLKAGLGASYLDAFEACTGVDRSAMRFGWVQGGSTLGVIPMAIEIDGYSGWELADLMVDGNALQPDLRSHLRVGEHDGWTYLYTEGFAVTASAETLYLMQQFCCVDVMDPDADLPAFEEIVNDYLDRTRNNPAPVPAD